MLDWYRTYAAAPQLSEELRRANEERAAAWYEVFRAAAGAARSGLDRVGSGVSTLRRWRREREAIRKLSALDDRLLADIGLARHQIPEAVRAFSKVSTGTLQEQQALAPERWSREPDGLEVSGKFVKPASSRPLAVIDGGRDSTAGREIRRGRRERDTAKTVASRGGRESRAVASGR